MLSVMLNVKVYPNNVIFVPLADVSVDPGWAKDWQLVPAEKNDDASDGLIAFGYI